MDYEGDDDDGTCEAIIPGLPDDLALRCLAKISHGYHGLLQCVSKKWKRAIRSVDYAHVKAREGWCGDWLFVLGADSPTLWHAYDPDADRWHPLPRMPGFTDDDELCRFSCVSVGNKFLVIGGCHISHSEKRCWETRSLMVFDPFMKQWKGGAYMQTARTDFACAVISDKVYVAGGSNSSSSEGLATAEVYDPDADKWEDLPSMPFPLIECFSISHGGQFHVVGKRISNFQHDTYVIFNPSEQKWHVMEDLPPVCKLSRDTTTIIESDIYSMLPDGTVTMVMPDQKGWHALGVYPAVVLPDHDRPLRPFGFGFIALGSCIYVVGGMVLKYNTSNHTWIGNNMLIHGFPSRNVFPYDSTKVDIVSGYTVLHKAYIFGFQESRDGTICLWWMPTVKDVCDPIVDAPRT
ncbi:Kelch motif [Musa troglodytarum]|uniref:Kelch motif n=1 Tax=Musa troglodytarum TaxID=320322 RepID=A0A9E7F3D3_9LILI|nr:Kelch motif [Musa troglodytarum]